MRKIVTNNMKVQSYFKGKAEITMVDTDMQVLQEGLQIIENGGRLLHDPLRGSGHYRSLLFTMDTPNIPADNNIAALNQCLKKIQNKENKENKEPIFAWIYQNRDLNLIKTL